MNIIEEIKKLIADYHKRHGENPTKVFLTRKEEKALFELPEVDQVKGPRKTFKKELCGLKVTWDAKYFSVE